MNQIKIIVTFVRFDEKHARTSLVTLKNKKLIYNVQSKHRYFCANYETKSNGRYKTYQISEYNYPLPDERIAKFPLAVRDQSKLLVYRHGEVSEDTFTALPEYLEQGELMIFNNTKVIQARLHFRKETGALIEVFCLEPIQPNDYVLSFQQTKNAAGSA